VHVAPALHGRFGRPYTYVVRCASTQRLLDGAPEGAVAVTDEQTEGRGRLGRSWHAPAGSSLLFSIVLTPPVAADRLPELSLVAGAAVADAIAEVTGLAPTVKHPNDVLIGGRKVAGILAEASEGRVVLGIGINVSQAEAELPPGVDATSLRAAGAKDGDRGQLLATVLARLEAGYDAWVTGAGRAQA
jgi:BirA family transcriptional regulator, biotin operon repressor / biotin---[acetyl-CoA-carboxylase] ligase